MLEPRWSSHSATNCTFIGGTPDVDLWFRKKALYTEASLRVVNGHTPTDWAAYPFRNGKIEGYGDGDENDMATEELRKLVAEKREEIETYVALFAPWAVEHSHDGA